MKAIKFIFTASLTLLIVIILEGMITLGRALDQKHFDNPIYIISQSCVLLLVLSFSLLIVNQKKE